MKPEPRRVERLLEQVRRTAKNCRFEDLQNLLVAAGFAVRSSGGSHYVFKRGSQVLIVPFSRPVKENYVKRALQMIEDQE